MTGSELFDLVVRSWSWVSLASQLAALLSIPSVLVQRRGRPLAALSWILAMAAIPVLGCLLWWLIGRTYLERRRRRRRSARQDLEARLEAVREVTGNPPSLASGELQALTRLPAEFASSVFPASAGNRARLLVDASEAYPAMEAAIRAARHHIHLLYYIWQDDATGRRLRDLLAERAQAGIEVRALWDAVGSRSLGRGFCRPLEAAGARVARFLPPGSPSPQP